MIKTVSNHHLSNSSIINKRLRLRLRQQQQQQQQNGRRTIRNEPVKAKQQERTARDEEQSVQLGTAKLPKDIDIEQFKSSLYQWATTLNHSGQNMPFVLPQRVDKTACGFEMDFLKSNSKTSTNEFVSCGTIEAKVEESNDGQIILMVRGYGDVKVPKKLVDVAVVMQTMPNAIKRAIQISMP